MVLDSDEEDRIWKENELEGEEEGEKTLQHHAMVRGEGMASLPANCKALLVCLLLVRHHAVVQGEGTASLSVSCLALLHQ